MARGDFFHAFVQFMRGRNGTDDLVRIAVCLGIVLLLFGMYLSVLFLRIAALASLGYAYWRMMSRNIAARARENEKVMSRLSPVRPWVVSPRAAWHEMRAYKHCACPTCGQRIRIPRGKGRVRVVCPACRDRFEVRV